MWTFARKDSSIKIKFGLKYFKIAMSDLCPVAVSQHSTELECQPKTVIESHLLLWKSKKYCDVTFTFPNLPDQIQAHEFCLKARSPVFEQIFQLRKSGNVQGEEIQVSECTPERFHEFLEFIYSDKFDTDITGALDLLHLAQKYKVQLLTEKCEALLKTKIQITDSVSVFESARHYGHQEVMARASEVMVKSLQNVIKIGALAAAGEETVVYLLELDDLTVKEVKLFEFILEWSRKQVGFSADEQLLKNKLENVISKIRYTNMTAHEFTKVVVPTGLLSAGEIISVYSYLCGDETSRKDMQIRFNVMRRKGERVETFVNFFKDQQSEDLWAPAFSRQSICFEAERMQLVTNDWSDYPFKKAAITGIQFQWPEIKPFHKRSFTFNFHVAIGEASDPLNESNFTFKFQKTLMDCLENSVDYVAVDPPVEFISGRVYCVTVEDRSTSDLNNRHRNVDELFYGGDCFPDTKNREASVYLEGARLTLKQIQKKDKYYREKFSGKYSKKIAVIRGIKIGIL